MELSPRAKQALAEKARRERARRRLEPFTTYTFPKYVVEPVHSLIASTLDRIVSGEIKRLMIFAPPQHGKSELVSVRLPAAWLGRRPEDPVILSSYAASLAEGKSRQVRQIVEGEEFHHLFPGLHTRADSRAVDEWHLADHRGYLKAVGVGGPVTGHGSMLGIIDDPFENWAQAQSKTIRDKVWDWWRATFRTRIWEGGAVVLIMTRWHTDDLAGRLLAEQGNEWMVLRLPAVAETQQVRDEAARLLGLRGGLPDPLGRQPGEPLAPRRYSAEALAALRRDVGSLAWAAEYQGFPHEPEGNLFKRGWFGRFRNLGDAYQLDTGELFYKRECVHFALCDPAASDKPTANNTALGLFAQTPSQRPGRPACEPRLLILKMATQKLRFEHVAGRAKEFYDEHRPEWIGVEAEMIFDSVAREMLRLKLPVRRLKTGGKTKFVRAMPAIARCEAGQVLLPVSDGWVPDFLDEVAKFSGFDDPQDDQVDLLSYGCQILTGEQCTQSFTPYVHPSNGGSYR